MILSGDLYRVIVAVYLLQLYSNRSPLLEYVDRGSSIRYFLRHPLRYPLGHPLGHLLGHPVQA